MNPDLFVSWGRLVILGFELSRKRAKYNVLHKGYCGDALLQTDCSFFYAHGLKLICDKYACQRHAAVDNLHLNTPPDSRRVHVFL